MAGGADIMEIGAGDAGLHRPECCARPVEFDDERVFSIVVAAPLNVARRYSRVVQHWVDSHLKAAKAQAEYEENLEMSERRFRDVAESAGDWIWEMDANLRFTYESPRFFEIFPVQPLAVGNLFGHRERRPVRIKLLVASQRPLYAPVLARWNKGFTPIPTHGVARRPPALWDHRTVASLLL